MPNFAGAQAACLDFAVTHTQQPNILECASVCGGAAAEGYEVTVKDAAFVKEYKAAGLVLVPMVVEVFGRWGRSRPYSWRQRGVRTGLASASRLLGPTCAGVCLSPYCLHPAGPHGPCVKSLCRPSALVVGPRHVVICGRGS